MVAVDFSAACLLGLAPDAAQTDRGSDTTVSLRYDRHADCMTASVYHGTHWGAAYECGTINNGMPASVVSPQSAQAVCLPELDGAALPESADNSERGSNIAVAPNSIDAVAPVAAAVDASADALSAAEPSADASPWSVPRIAAPFRT